MIKRRLKILVLGHTDSRQFGHAYSLCELLDKELFDPKLIVLEAQDPKKDFVPFFDCSSLWGKLLKKIHFLRQRLLLWFKIHSSFSFNLEEYNEHYFSLRICNSITASDILSKCGDFVPDLIFLGWSSTIVSAKTARELYDKTGAVFVYNHIDEQHMTGGCHYPIDCNGYLSVCMNCPVIKKGKEIAHIQLLEAKRFLTDIPKISFGTKYSCELAKNVSIFRDAVQLKLPPVIPTIKSFSKNESRNRFGIGDDEFVVFAGAQSISSKRKGFKYAIEAVNKISSKYSNICFLLLGSKDCENEIINQTSDKIHLIMPGFLNGEDFFKAYCASDCYLNTTIADSGPMMVNYAITLGCPTISFNIGVAQDLVLHKQTGYIAELRDSDSVCDGLEYIYSLSEEDLRNIKSNCTDLLQRISEEKSWQTILYEEYMTMKDKC